MNSGVMLMPKANTMRTRIILTLAVAVYEAVHLGWEYRHGGVVSHHILQRPDLPAISNWWGLILLPVLAWCLIGRMQARDNMQSLRFPSRAMMLRFLAALLYGAGLAAAFSLGLESVTSALFFALFALAVAFPLFRAEYVLGFVVGMTFVFGAVLPTIIACIFAAISAVLHRLARLLGGAVVRLVAWARDNGSK
jgi:hypothetical protein